MNNQNIINMIEDNFFHFSFLLGQGEKGIIYDGEDIKWSYSGLNVLARVIYLDIPEENINKKVEEMIAIFRLWKVPFAWFIGPSTNPNNLFEYLGKYNFINTGDWVGMARDMEAGIEQTDLKDLEIKEIDNNEKFDEWGEIICEGFEIHDYFKKDTLKVFSDLIRQGNKDLKHYIAYCNGVPASACTLFTGMKGIAGIYFVATKPEFRGRGYATVLIQHALNVAKNEGCDMSVLQATDIGFSVYEKMGYKEYCRFNVYVWTPYQ